jgi:hypothetical protein
MQKINQASGKSCHPVPQKNVTDKQEDFPSDHIHPECNLSHDSHGQDVHSPFVIYTLCDQLNNGMGNALIDTGSQVSLAVESKLARGLRINP